jgi:hypothetical protein
MLEQRSLFYFYMGYSKFYYALLDLKEGCEFYLF